MLCPYCNNEIFIGTEITHEGISFCSVVCVNKSIIMGKFNWRCALNPSHGAKVIHEIIPKSLRPRDWWELDNMIPLCHSCHIKVHQEGTKKYREQLQEILNGKLSGD